MVISIAADVILLKKKSVILPGVNDERLSSLSACRRFFPGGFRGILRYSLGAFFSEVGNRLLADLIGRFNNREEISRNLNVTADWTTKDFKRADAFAYHLKIDIDIHKIDLEGLKTFLAQKRLYLLTLLENPNLLEHDRFTDLLWATTHLDEELEARPSLENLPESDLEHLTVDIERMYDHLASEWLDYVQHLKSSYPFLYSLVLRTHPFQESPSAVVA
jgi:hypothetical protein